jgi:acetoin utilization deacetylase AcuC-like enzyme
MVAKGMLHVDSMTAYITHNDCLLHEMVPGHPECPARMHAIEDRLHAAGVFHFLRYHEAPPATIEQLVRVHERHHVEQLIATSPKSGLAHLDGDTSLNPHTIDAALRAAGANVLATDLVIGGKDRNAFCNVRPPGHHAEHHRAMGFCLFNNVAVGAAHALEHHGLERVAIVDFDVHHGNGTEDIFRDDYRIMLCSSFQHPFYPYSDAESVPGHLVKAPLEAGSNGAEFRRVITETWLPELEAFQPGMIFVSAGFDAHREDYLAHLNLVEDDYVWITERIMDIAARHAGGRIVSTLEGGYALSALGRSATVHIKTLLGI